jgi:dynein heavy chain
LNIPGKYAPDPRTFLILNKLIDQKPVVANEDAILEAFYSYFDSTLKQCSVAQIEDSSIEKIMMRIPNQLRFNFPEMVEILFREVKDCYVEAGKQCSGFYC